MNKLLLAILTLGILAGFASAFVEKFDTNPDTTLWYVDRYAPNAFISSFFDGDNRLLIGINSADWQSYDFYNTQGRKRDVANGVDSYISGKLYIPAEWATAPTVTDARRSDIWATAIDATNAISGYPIIGFTNEENNPRYRYWDSNTGWTDLTVPVTYNTWHEFKIKLTAASFEFYLDNNLVATDTLIDGSVAFTNIIMQAKNFNNTYDVYWDDVTYRLNQTADNVLYLEPTENSIYIKPGESILVDMNVANLLQKVNGCQAILGYSSAYFADPTGGCVTAGGGAWDQLIWDSWSDTSGLPGEIDTAIGVNA